MSIAEQLSDETGLPLADLLDGGYDLEMLLWDSPDEDGTDMDDVEDFLEGHEPDESQPFLSALREYLNEGPEEHADEMRLLRYDVSSQEER